jgi:hypothetical protein
MNRGVEQQIRSNFEHICEISTPELKYQRLQIVLRYFPPDLYDFNRIPPFFSPVPRTQAILCTIHVFKTKPGDGKMPNLGVCHLGMGE